ncbi:hypothetical protein C8R44DRAFT_725103 [Mycena epipterygia]|nr:hypothetical protein C8R44DRAFT_725103 [Mycena epipterygia]
MLRVTQNPRGGYPGPALGTTHYALGKVNEDHDNCRRYILKTMRSAVWQRCHDKGDARELLGRYQRRSDVLSLVTDSGRKVGYLPWIATYIERIAHGRYSRMIRTAHRHPNASPSAIAGLHPDVPVIRATRVWLNLSMADNGQIFEIQTLMVISNGNGVFYFSVVRFYSP